MDNAASTAPTPTHSTSAQYASAAATKSPRSSKSIAYEKPLMPQHQTTSKNRCSAAPSRRKKQNPSPTRPVGSVILPKFADSLATLASPRRAPGPNRGPPSNCCRARPSSRSSPGVRTMKANPAPSRGKSKSRAHPRAKHAARWSGSRTNSARDPPARRVAAASPSRRKSTPARAAPRRRRHQVSPASPKRKKRFGVRLPFRPPAKIAGSRNAAPTGHFHPTRAFRCLRASALRQIAPAPPSRPPAKCCGFPEGQKHLHPEPNRYAVAIATAAIGG